MRWQPALIGVLLTVLGAAPAYALNEDERSTFPRPLSVHVGLGSHLNDGGDVESVSVGYEWSNVALLVNVERNHVPTRVTTLVRGGSVTRGGTLTSLSGELRYTIPIGQRVSPFVTAGVGGGVSRPNVNDYFPDEISNRATLAYWGGGVRVRLRPSVSLFADTRLMLVLERDSLGGRVPIRGGVTWHF